MRQKISPGMMLDIVTPEELAGHFESHANTLLNLLGRNARFKRVIDSAKVGADGTISVVSSPPDGFLWEIRGITIWQPSGDLNTMEFFINDSSSSINRYADVQPGTLTSVPSKTVILHSTDQSIGIFQNPQVGLAGLSLAVCYWVVEVPNSHEAQLLM